MKQSTFSAQVANKLLTVLQGYTKGIRFVAVLTVLHTMGIGQVWGADLAVNDVLFLENFKGGTTSTSFTAQTYSATYSSITMKVTEDAGSISRASNSACFRNTSASNMDSHHAWLNKSTTGYIEIDNIQLHNVTKFQASWAQSGEAAITFYYKFNNDASWTNGGASNAAANADAKSNVITVPDGKTSVSIKFQRTSNTKNQRIDKLKLVVTEVAASCSNQVTITKASVTGGSFKVRQGSASGTEISSGDKIDNCDANAVVVVVPSASANYTCTGVTATNSNSISGPDGNGNYTITYTKGSNIASEISVTFTENRKYTVTWMVDKDELSTEDVYENGKVSSVPTVTELPCGDKFVGWTTDPITTPQDSAPTVVFTTVDGSPDIKEPTTFYAVFADYVNE